jgi:UDPglucose 6-dehydrogenase
MTVRSGAVAPPAEDTRVLAGSALRFAPAHVGSIGRAWRTSNDVELFVIGVGYVGLTTAVGMTTLGHHVVAHDTDGSRLATIAAGRSPIFEPGLEEAIAAALSSGRLSVTRDGAPPPSTEVVMVCVPTPKATDGRLDSSIVESVVERLVAQLRVDQTIVVRSTLPLEGPARLESLARDGGPAIVINPEFMREGHALADFLAPSRAAIGWLRVSDRKAAAEVSALYEPLAAPLVTGDARSIVLLKLASNVFLGMKVAFANELARLADAIGADVSIVSHGIGLDPRIGTGFLEPGPGFGGSCLPDQAAAIAAETAMRSIASPLLASIAVSNETHQEALVQSVGRLLSPGLAQARIAVLGLAFKANTDDVRASPGLALARRFQEHGATVVGHDPVAAERARALDPHLLIVATAEAALAGVDAVVLATEWAQYRGIDWRAAHVAMRGDLVFDTRRTLDGAAVRAAGLRYVPLGRAGVTADPVAPLPAGRAPAGAASGGD